MELISAVSVLCASDRDAIPIGIARWLAGKKQDMKFYYRAQTLLKQFIHNLDEDNWASRHVGDAGPDLPAAAEPALSGRGVSSLSLALQQMGLIRQPIESSWREFDA